MTLLTLKSYQQAALDALRAFDRAAQLKGQALAFGEQVGRPYNPDSFGTVPCIYLRIPTGGGKTLMAAHTVNVLAQQWRATDAPVAVWLVPRDPLHNSLRSVVARARAVRCVVFLANSGAIGCKKTPCGPSRSAYHSSARVMQRVTREARIYSSWRAITWLGRSAALVFLQISRYLLQKPPCIPSRSKRRASTRINPRLPSDTIRSQTLKALQTTGHPYREALESSYGADVRVCVLEDLANIAPPDWGQRAVVVVATIQSFRIGDTDKRNVYSFSESFERHFKASRVALQRCYQFSKYFYPVQADLNDGGEEFLCAQLLDNHATVKHWVRNLTTAPYGFALATSKGRFYPDFVAELLNGRVAVVEYKGAHLLSDPYEIEKRHIGELWARKIAGKCLFGQIVKDRSGLGMSGQLDALLT